MNELNIYDRWNYKYRLLYCLMLNYYRNHYADNKFKGKVLVLCTSKKRLMDEYDKLYSTIRCFTVEDVKTLYGFIGRHDKELKQLFEDLEEHNVYFDYLIQGIKKEYISERATYKECIYGDVEHFPSGKNITFINFEDVDLIYDKHLVREMFIPEHFNMRRHPDSNCNELCNILTKYTREITKAKAILKSNNAQETEYLSLNVFINGEDGLAFIDEVNNRLTMYDGE